VSVREAFVRAESLFWVSAVLVAVVGATQSHHLPMWANACLVVAFMICSKTPRTLKEVREREEV
jgi:hypothetical protein